VTLSIESQVKVRENGDASLVRTPDEVIHLIRELRWMGMADEAKMLQARLTGCRDTLGDNVIVGPTDTD